MRLLHLRKNYIITMHKSHREKEERDMSGEDRRKAASADLGVQVSGSGFVSSAAARQSEADLAAAIVEEQQANGGGSLTRYVDPRCHDI